MAKQREYGRAGTMGIGVPQANTTAESEFRALAPDGVNLVTGRLQGSRSDSRTRLLDYFHNLGAVLDSFDVAPLGAFGFACTGSSYLLGFEQNRDAFAALSRARGYAVISAAEAIIESLEDIGTKRIAMVSPYPLWLNESSLAYWRAAGIEVEEMTQVAADTSDTRNVYDVTSGDALAAANKLRRGSAGAILLSGTGMPTLRALGEITRATGKPAISSNLCLCWAMQKRLGLPGRPPWEDRAGWESRLDRL